MTGLALASEHEQECRLRSVEAGLDVKRRAERFSREIGRVCFSTNVHSS